MDRTVKLLIQRTHGRELVTVSVPQEASILDALEAAYRQDHTLMFRHSCHHASCGSCGMIINQQERLACATSIEIASDEREVIHIEPMRHFPRIGDLAVDMTSFLANLEEINRPLVRQDESKTQYQALISEGPQPFHRFENCIECGLCISACPIAGIRKDYLGPAVLAAADRLVDEPRGRDLSQVPAAVDRPNGIWRCHDVFLCTEVCPAGVHPAEAIVSLRQALIFHRQGGSKDEATL